MYPFDCFQLNDDAAFDQQIQFELAVDALPFVQQWDVPLALDTKVIPSDFDDHAFPIDGFQQTRTEGAVYFDGVANNSLCQLLDFRNSGSHVRCQSTYRAGSFSRVFAHESPENGSICQGSWNVHGGITALGFTRDAET